MWLMIFLVQEASLRKAKGEGKEKFSRKNGP